LFPTFVAQLRAVVGPDQVAKILEQFDNREGLFARPIRRNANGKVRSDRVEGGLTIEVPSFAPGGGAAMISAV
jgi:hypothetical protein